jgi:hypothetical protein
MLRIQQRSCGHTAIMAHFIAPETGVEQHNKNSPNIFFPDSFTIKAGSLMSESVNNGRNYAVKNLILDRFQLSLMTLDTVHNWFNQSEEKTAAITADRESSSEFCTYGATCATST